MISTRSGALVIKTVVCLTLAKWETVSGRFGGYLTLLNSTLAQHFFNPGSGATLTHYLKTVAARRQSPDGPRPNSPRWMQLQLAYSGSDIEADLPLHG
jgi:hypothetical protein